VVRPGTFHRRDRDNNAKTAVNGLGTVHHVAMAIATREEQVALREICAIGVASPTCAIAATSRRSISASRRRAVRGRDDEAGFTVDEASRIASAAISSCRRGKSSIRPSIEANLVTGQVR
jgi:hypothetical protein